MRLQEEHEQMTQARIELSKAVTEIGTNHDLTIAQMLTILTERLAVYVRHAREDEQKPPTKSR